MINVKGLNKYYNKGKNNEIHVINDTTFELPSTGLVTFLGESGSGKTTLLNVIGGLDKASGRIDYGDINIKNYQMSKIDKYRRNNIGYIFQNYNIIPNITVYENLRVALDIIGVTDPIEVDKRIEYALKAVGMFKFRKKLAYALSGGQQQRVSIARALIKESKIIIADEPTGNLDSKNTVEVMNILKKISKNSLILLVTHEKRICDFYSDLVFTVSDGKITGKIEQANKGAVLIDEDQNKIYKGDLEYKNVENEIGSIELYSNEEINDLNIKLYVKNGTIYLDSNKPIKLLNQSGVTVVDGKKEVLTSSDILAEEFEYSPDFKKGNRRGLFSAFKRSLLAAWARLQPSRKRTKVIYAVLVLLGSLFALALVLLINLQNDDYNYRKFANKNMYTLKANDYDNSDDVINGLDSLYDSGMDLILSSYADFDITKRLSLSYDIDYDATLHFVIYDESYAKISMGRAPKSPLEVVLSRKNAQEIIDKYQGIISLDDIIGATIRNSYLRSLNFTIVGLSSDDSDIMYMQEDYFYLFLSLSAYIDYFYISDDYYDIVEGRSPVNDNEIIVPKSRGYNVNDIIDNKYTVVGLYEGITEYMYISTKKASLDEMEYHLKYYNNYYGYRGLDDCIFISKGNIKAYKEYLTDKGYDVSIVSVKDYYNSQVNSNTRELYIMVAVVAGISALFIYFTMRSKMISDIYTIGVYRSLGMSRRRIIGQFILDSFILGTFTSIVGYFLGYFIYLGIVTLSQEVFNTSLLATNVEMLFAGAGVLYLIVIFTGILPIVTLLRKTPKEICNKYDI